MTNFSAYDLTFSGSGIFSAPVPKPTLTEDSSVEYSGVVLNQNGELTGSQVLGTDWLYQTFRFPKDYPRGVSGEGITVVPKMCGFQVNVEIAQGLAYAVALDWRIDYWSPVDGWVGVVEGTEVGAPADGATTWFDINFEPVDITDFWWRKFRFGISGRDGDPEQIKVLIPYDGKQITVNDKIIDIVPTISKTPLLEGKRYAFQLPGQPPALIEVRGGEALYSEQQGIEGVVYTAPNPQSKEVSTEFVSVNSDAIDAAVNTEFAGIEAALPLATADTSDSPITETTIPRIVGSDIKAYLSDGVQVLEDPDLAGEESSLRYRIMALAPDVDRDCTGNVYRTVAIQSDPTSVKASVGDLQDAYWLSEPNPSQFACEALYFDIRKGGEPQVVDHVIIDPATPGIYMNIYFSDDPEPGYNRDSWDSLLWSRVDKQYLLRRKETFALPQPITAKYIKLEFTQLQPIWYAPGTFTLPTEYRKHPKWVMDYYLSYYQYVRAQDLEEAQFVNVSYDALDLAYNYYLDDLKQEYPNLPATVQSAEGVSLLTDFLRQEQNTENTKVDPQTLLQIKTSLRPFTTQPGNQGKFGSLLQKLAQSSITADNYSTESTVTPTAFTRNVSSYDRDSLIVEKAFPVTSFYLTARHYYMVATAPFDHDRAYFAGIKEVTFTREHYASRYDNDLYIETAGDTENIASNDFESVNHDWVTYSTTS